MSNLIEEIIELIDELICKRKEIVSNVKDVRNQAEKHHRDSNIAKSVGATAAAVGGVTAIFTGGLSLVVAASVAAAGAATSIGTSIADPFKSKEFLGKIREIADSQKEIAEKLKEKLEQYDSLLKIYAKTTGCSEDVAAYTIVRAIGNGSLKVPQHGIDVADAVLQFKEERQAIKAASRASSSRASQASFVTANSSASFKTARSTSRVSSSSASRASSLGSRLSSTSSASVRSSVQVAKSGGRVALKTLSKGLLVLNIGWDIVDVIHGWATDHPTVKTMNDLIKSVKEGIKELEELKADLQKKLASDSDSDSASDSELERAIGTIYEDNSDNELERAIGTIYEDNSDNELERAIDTIYDHSSDSDAY